MTKQHRNMLNELLADDSDRLTDWEIDWITHVDRWTGDLRPAQVKKIEEIWTKVFGG